MCCNSFIFKGLDMQYEWLECCTLLYTCARRTGVYLLLCILVHLKRCSDHITTKCKCTFTMAEVQKRRLEHLQQAPLKHPASMLQCSMLLRGTEWLCQGEGMSFHKRFHCVCVGGIVSLLWTGRAEVEQSSKRKCWEVVVISLSVSVLG